MKARTGMGSKKKKREIEHMIWEEIACCPCNPLSNPVRIAYNFGSPVSESHFNMFKKYYKEASDGK